MRRERGTCPIAVSLGVRPLPLTKSRIFIAKTFLLTTRVALTGFLWVLSPCFLLRASSCEPIQEEMFLSIHPPERDTICVVRSTPPHWGTICVVRSTPLC